MVTAAIASRPASPLDQSHQRELAAAAERARPIRKAARVASFNAWTTTILAACSAPFALFGMAGLLVFVGLSAIAWNEFRGRRRLLNFEPAGAAILGWNQLGLLAMITIYCVWALYSGLLGANSIEAQLKANPELEAALGSVQGLEGFDQLYRTLVVALYSSVIVLSAIFQGANALYYFTRRKYAERYVRETPSWLIELQRATSTT